jgi:hypothetical protein
LIPFFITIISLLSASTLSWLLFRILTFIAELKVEQIYVQLLGIPDATGHSGVIAERRKPLVTSNLWPAKR